MIRLVMLIKASILSADDPCSVLCLSSKELGSAYFVSLEGCSTSVPFRCYSSCRREEAYLIQRQGDERASNGGGESSKGLPRRCT